MFDTSKRLAQTVSVLALALAGFAAMPAIAQDAAPAAPAAEAAAGRSACAESSQCGRRDGGRATPSPRRICRSRPKTWPRKSARCRPNSASPFLLRVLIDMKVMAKAARDAKMDQEPLFQQRVGYLEDQALRRAYFGEAIAGTVTRRRRARQV